MFQLLENNTLNNEKGADPVPVLSVYNSASPEQPATDNSPFGAFQKTSTSNVMDVRGNTTSPGLDKFVVLTSPWNTEDVDYASATPGTSQRVVFEPLSPDPYNLTYACLLIPRFNTHQLRGDLADSLYDQMRRICVSYGWRLELIGVQPAYLQWVMTVPAATSPSTFMRTIRLLTSQQIFDDFPRIKRENLAKDFWAPGYLVLVSTQPHSPEMIAEFIRLTRQQQGLPSD